MFCVLVIEKSVRLPQHVNYHGCHRCCLFNTLCLYFYSEVVQQSHCVASVFFKGSQGNGALSLLEQMVFSCSFPFCGAGTTQFKICPEHVLTTLQWPTCQPFMMFLMGIKKWLWAFMLFIICAICPELSLQEYCCNTGNLILI